MGEAIKGLSNGVNELKLNPCQVSFRVHHHTLSASVQSVVHCHDNFLP